MKFLADVNITQTVITYLRKAGYDVTDIKQKNRKSSDIEIVKLALKEKRIVLTHDKDFLGLTQYPKYQVSIILFRLQIQNAEYFREKLQELIENQSEEILEKSLTIIKEESAESYPYKD